MLRSILKFPLDSFKIPNTDSNLFWSCSTTWKVSDGIWQMSAISRSLFASISRSPALHWKQWHRMKDRKRVSVNINHETRSDWHEEHFSLQFQVGDLLMQRHDPSLAYNLAPLHTDDARESTHYLNWFLRFRFLHQNIKRESWAHSRFPSASLPQFELFNNQLQPRKV